MEVRESCQFSSLCLWTSCRVTIVLICLNILLIFITWGLSYVSKLFIDGMCVVALAPATKTMSRATFHPLVVMLLMNA